MYNRFLINSLFKYVSILFIMCLLWFLDNVFFINDVDAAVDCATGTSFGDKIDYCGVTIFEGEHDLSSISNFEIVGLTPSNHVSDLHLEDNGLYSLYTAGGYTLLSYHLDYSSAEVGTASFTLSQDLNVSVYGRDAGLFLSYYKKTEDTEAGTPVASLRGREIHFSHLIDIPDTNVNHAFNFTGLYTEDQLKNVQDGGSAVVTGTEVDYITLVPAGYNQTLPDNSGGPIKKDLFSLPGTYSINLIDYSLRFHMLPNLERIEISSINVSVENQQIEDNNALFAEFDYYGYDAYTSFTFLNVPTQSYADPTELILGNITAYGDKLIGQYKEQSDYAENDQHTNNSVSRQIASVYIYSNGFNGGGNVLCKYGTCSYRDELAYFDLEFSEKHINEMSGAVVRDLALDAGNILISDLSPPDDGTTPYKTLLDVNYIDPDFDIVLVGDSYFASELFIAANTITFEKDFKYYSAEGMQQESDGVPRVLFMANDINAKGNLQFGELGVTVKVNTDLDGKNETVIDKDWGNYNGAVCSASVAYSIVRCGPMDEFRDPGTQRVFVELAGVGWDPSDSKEYDQTVMQVEGNLNFYNTEDLVFSFSHVGYTGTEQNINYFDYVYHSSKLMVGGEINFSNLFSQRLSYYDLDDYYLPEYTLSNQGTVNYYGSTISGIFYGGMSYNATQLVADKVVIKGTERPFLINGFDFGDTPLILEEADYSGIEIDESADTNLNDCIYEDAGCSFKQRMETIVYINYRAENFSFYINPENKGPSSYRSKSYIFYSYIVGSENYKPDNSFREDIPATTLEEWRSVYNDITVNENTFLYANFMVSNGTWNVRSQDIRNGDDTAVEANGEGYYQCNIGITYFCSSADRYVGDSDLYGVGLLLGDGVSLNKLVIEGGIVGMRSLPTYMDTYDGNNLSRATLVSEMLNILEMPQLEINHLILTNAQGKDSNGNDTLWLGNTDYAGGFMITDNPALFQYEQEFRLKPNVIDNITSDNSKVVIFNDLSSNGEYIFDNNSALIFGNDKVDTARLNVLLFDHQSEFKGNSILYISSKLHLNNDSNATIGSNAVNRDNFCIGPVNICEPVQNDNGTLVRDDYGVQEDVNNSSELIVENGSSIYVGNKSEANTVLDLTAGRILLNNNQYDVTNVNTATMYVQGSVFLQDQQHTAFDSHGSYTKVLGSFHADNVVNLVDSQLEVEFSVQYNNMSIDIASDALVVSNALTMENSNLIIKQGNLNAQGADLQLMGSVMSARQDAYMNIINVSSGDIVADNLMSTGTNIIAKKLILHGDEGLRINGSSALNITDQVIVDHSLLIENSELTTDNLVLGSNVEDDFTARNSQIIIGTSSEITGSLYLLNSEVNLADSALNLTTVELDGGTLTVKGEFVAETLTIKNGANIVFTDAIDPVLNLTNLVIDNQLLDYNLNIKDTLTVTNIADADNLSSYNKNINTKNFVFVNANVKFTNTSSLGVTNSLALTDSYVEFEKPQDFNLVGEVMLKNSVLLNISNITANNINIISSDLELQSINVANSLQLTNATLTAGTLQMTNSNEGEFNLDGSVVTINNNSNQIDLVNMSLINNSNIIINDQQTILSADNVYIRDSLLTSNLVMNNGGILDIDITQNINGDVINGIKADKVEISNTTLAPYLSSTSRISVGDSSTYYMLGAKELTVNNVTYDYSNFEGLFKYKQLVYEDDNYDYIGFELERLYNFEQRIDQDQKHQDAILDTTSQFANFFDDLQQEDPSRIDPEGQLDDIMTHLDAHFMEDNSASIVNDINSIVPVSPSMYLRNTHTLANSIIKMTDTEKSLNATTSSSADSSYLVAHNLWLKAFANFGNNADAFEENIIGDSYTMASILVGYDLIDKFNKNESRAVNWSVYTGFSSGSITQDSISVIDTSSQAISVGSRYEMMFNTYTLDVNALFLMSSYNSNRLDFTDSMNTADSSLQEIALNLRAGKDLDFTITNNKFYDRPSLFVTYGTLSGSEINEAGFSGMNLDAYSGSVMEFGIGNRILQEKNYNNGAILSYYADVEVFSRMYNSSDFKAYYTELPDDTVLLGKYNPSYIGGRLNLATAYTKGSFAVKAEYSLEASGFQIDNQIGVGVNYLF